MPSLPTLHQLFWLSLTRDIFGNEKATAHGTHHPLPRPNEKKIIPRSLKKNEPTKKKNGMIVPKSFLPSHLESVKKKSCQCPIIHTWRSCAPPEGAMALSGASSRPKPCSQVRTSAGSWGVMVLRKVCSCFLQKANGRKWK